MPDDTRRLRQLAGRIDRLADGLDAARGAVLAGVFIVAMLVVVVLAAMLQSWLPPLPIGWGGAAAFLIAAAATWWAARRTTPFVARPGRRLAVSRRLEAAHPELGERISRAIGFATTELLSARAASQTAARSTTQQLERAALEAAADALDGLDRRRWLWTEPEVIGAAIMLPAAVLAATLLGVSLASMPSWRQAVARQLGIAASEDHAGQGGARSGDGTEGRSAAIDHGADSGAPEVPSIEQVTLATYRDVCTLAQAWQQLAATASDDAERVAATMQATRDAARRAARDLARVRHSQDPQAAAAPAVVLEAMTRRLEQVVDEERIDAVDETVRPVDQAAAWIASAREIARAAAGLAEAADRSQLLATALAAEAPRTAGRRPAELPDATQDWLLTIAGLADDIEIGTLADRDTLGAGLQPSRWPWHASLPNVPTAGTPDAIRDNRLFVASRQLTQDARMLAAAAAGLGMPVLEADAGWSTAALARRRLRTILHAAQPPDTEALGSRDAAAPSDATGEASSATSAPLVSAGDASTGLASTDVPLAATAQSSQPAGGGGTTAAPQPGDATSGSPQAPLPVWVPLAPDAVEPRQPQPAPREPPATPGYFRRLDAAVPLSRFGTGGRMAIIDHAVSPWVGRGIGSTLILAAAVVQSDTEATGEAAAGEGRERLRPAATDLPVRPDDPPDAEAASRAVERAADWLVSVQRADGSWGSQRFVGSVAVTSHGLLALASTGSTPAAGPRAAAADRAISPLSSAWSSSGLIAANEVGANGPMYGHAAAILALAELAGESNRPEIPAVLARGCRLLEQTQNTEGGWRYQPRQGDADISVTSAVIVALEAAAAAGLDISSDTIDRGTAYVARLHNEDGGFRYQSAVGPSGPARTAAALVALSLAAPHQRQLLADGRSWLARHPQRPDPGDGYAAYGILASSTAAWQESPSAWARWYRDTSAALLAAQRADGSWDDPSCAEYGTSAAILALTTANGLLPGLQRGQGGEGDGP